nr:gem-associated protein 2 isoform X2 [Zootoca vivipara]
MDFSEGRILSNLMGKKHLTTYVKACVKNALMVFPAWQGVGLDGPRGLFQLYDSNIFVSLNKKSNLPFCILQPGVEDEEGWKRFCLGEKSYLDTAVEVSRDEDQGIDYVQIGFPPLLSIVSRMNQATVTSVLEYLTNWLAEKEFTPELGRWLYALLACLEKPLLPEAHSLIRQLARRCSEVRVLEENKNDEKVSALNLLICLVGRYFDQHDLADEAS